MPFHTRLLGKDRLALYSFIHSLNTNFGTTIFEPVAVALASTHFKVAEEFWDFLGGKGAYDNLIASTGFAVLTPKNNVVPKYLKYLLSSSYFLNKVSFWSVGVNYPSINNNRLMSIKIAVPPTLKEQIEIIEKIEKWIEKLNYKISKAQTEIKKIKEYKESLITNVVTGKIKVPDVTKM